MNRSVHIKGNSLLKIVVIVALTMNCFSITGQGLQHGLIKTLGRPNKPGKGIAGVLVKVAEVPNNMLTDAKGNISFHLNGNQFMLSRIKKNDYQLIDKSVIGRRFPYSSHVPFEIVLVSNQDLATDKQRIEDKAFERAERNYKQQIATLEDLIKKKEIDEEKANQERQRIGENYQRFVEQIDQMAERYATTNYDGISNINKQILECIEEANLDRADSLIRSKGDFDRREAEIKEQEQMTESAERFVQESKQSLEIKRNDLAQDFYNKHTIFLTNYQNDSAAYYIERRALLDTTNLEWIKQAGMFIDEYMADYRKAIYLFQKMYNYTIKTNDDNNENLAICNILIGSVLKKQCHYTKAMEYFLHAQSILEPSSSHINDLIDCYLKQASIFGECENYTQAFSLISKATQLIQTYYGEQSIQFAKALEAKAVLHIALKQNTSAYECLNSAQTIYETIHCGSQTDKAQHLCNLGYVLVNSEDYKKGQDVIQEAIDILSRIYGERHPKTSNAYHIMALLYEKQKDYEKARKYYTKELENSKHIFGNFHAFTAYNYISLGRICHKLSDDLNAVQYGNEALKILLKLEDIQDNKIMNLYQNMDTWVKKLKSEEMTPSAVQLCTEFGNLKGALLTRVPHT